MGPSTATKCISLQNRRLQSTLLKRLIPKNYFRVTVVNYTMQYTEYVNESRFPARSTRHDHVGSRAMANSRVLAREQGDQRLVVARTSSASVDTDAIAYGSLYIANSDLVARFKADAPLAEPDPATFYGSGPKGYTDYSALPAKDERPSRAVPRCHASRAAARRNAKSLCCLCRSAPRLRRSRRHRSG
jgi:hypothetical protein